MTRSHLAHGLAACLLMLAFAQAGTTQQDKPAEFALKSVKYKELGKLVRAQKGKVVVVDFWGLT